MSNLVYYYMKLYDKWVWMLYTRTKQFTKEMNWAASGNYLQKVWESKSNDKNDEKSIVVQNTDSIKILEDEVFMKRIEDMLY